jgi:hypothetical protein
MQERKRNILKWAIRNLPSFRLLKERTWEDLEKVLEERGGEGKLKKALDELPSYVLPNDIWPDIEERLEQKDIHLKKAIDDLPVFKVPSDLWKRLEEKAGLQKKTKISLYKSPVFRIAASITLLISITYLAYRFLIPEGDETISMHIEIIDDSKIPDIVPEGVGIQPIFNSQLCKGNPQLCSSPQFKELDRQLNELQNELDRILGQPGSKNDPQLIKYYYRLKNERVEVEKRMVKLIIQS